MTMAATLVKFFDIRGLIMLAVVFVPLERLFARRRAQRVFRKWWWNDVIYLFVNKIFITAGLVVTLVGTAVLIQGLVPLGLREAVANQPRWVQVLEALVIADLGFYGAHRMFHAVPWLWKFHAVHHSIEELDWLAAARIHPFDQVVTKTASMLPLYVLGFSGVALAIFSGIYFWQTFFIHANVRLRFGPLQWLIASPEFHHWHHANQPEAYNMNFAAQLVILDKLFGTLYMPAGQTPAKYGIDDPVPHTYVGHFFYPLKRQARTRPAQTGG